MAYITSDLSGFGKKLKRAMKKVVKAPLKVTKKVVKAPVKLTKKTFQIQKKIIKKAAKPIAKVALAPIAVGAKFAAETAKAGASYMTPQPIAEPSYPDFAPSLPAPAYVQAESYSGDYDMNDLERPMTNEQIRQYVEAREDASKTIDGLSGFSDRLKKLVKKAAVVVATIKGGPTAGKKVYDALLRKKGTSSDQSAVIAQAGDEAVNQGIPRAVGEKAARSFFTGKNIAIGGIALVGVGLLAFLMTRKR